MDSSGAVMLSNHFQYACDQNQQPQIKFGPNNCQTAQINEGNTSPLTGNDTVGALTLEKYVFIAHLKNKRKIQWLPVTVIGLYISACVLTWKLRDSRGPYLNADTEALCEGEKRE